jgi:hypothetical protein
VRRIVSDGCRPFRMSARTIKIFLGLLLAIVISVSLFRHFMTKHQFFGIIDYKPSSFTEQPTGLFFFSIGGGLKFGSVISDSAATLFEGALKNRTTSGVFPSPDQTKAAVMSDGSLYIVEVGKTATTILKGIGNFVPPSAPKGETIYEYPMLQWDAGSRYIYIVRDRKTEAVPAFKQTPDATLVRIDISDPTKIADVVSDFRSHFYFLIGDRAICFDYDADDRDLLWKCSYQGVTKAMQSIGENGITLVDGTSIAGKPFVSCHSDIYETEIWLSRYGFSLRKTVGKYIGLFSKDKTDTPIFLIKGGYNIKGNYVDGVSQRDGMVLPGERYALINVFHDNFTGQLLVDGRTGQYRELPHDTRVYRNLNTLVYHDIKFGLGVGPYLNRFVPEARFP